MLPRKLHFSLEIAEIVAFATLIRSVAFDRWITVLASALLLLGAAAAHRGRTWGVGLMLASACAFPVAWAIGIAPAWFCIVGAAGALPFVTSSKALARFDRGATLLMVILAACGGALGAMLWKEFAWSIFQGIPALRPSLHAQHGVWLLAIAALLVTTKRLTRRSEAQTAFVRVALPTRIETNAPTAHTNMEDEEEDAASPLTRSDAAVRR